MLRKGMGCLRRTPVSSPVDRGCLTVRTRAAPGPGSGLPPRCRDRVELRTRAQLARPVSSGRAAALVLRGAAPLPPLRKLPERPARLQRKRPHIAPRGQHLDHPR